MLHIFQSNCLQTLAEAMTGQMQATPPRSALAPVEIVIPDASLKDRLSQHLAEHTGICAKVKFHLPAGFIWSILHRCLPEMPEQSEFAPDILSWRLFDLLSQKKVWQQVPELHRYLEQASDSEVYELANQLAFLFDRYLVYRPDWINQWEQGGSAEQGPADHWQGVLWRHLAKGEAIHWVRQQMQLREVLHQADVPALPQQIYLFAMYSLSPGYLDLINAIAARTEVYLYVLNPSQEYWSLIRPRKDIVRKQLQGDAASYEEAANPLLAASGKVGQQFIEALLNYEADLDEDFVEPQADSLLGKIKLDVFNLQNKLVTKPADERCMQGDNSIQFHSCHSPQREVEVLHDTILATLEHYKGLGHGDIVVACSNVNDYAPYIQAVFERSRPLVPFSIQGQSLTSSNSVVQAFIDLLSVLSSRFEASGVIQLLEVDCIGSRFELDSDDVALIRRWIKRAGIKWGIDGEHKTELGLQPIGSNTWSEGVSRLLLGSVMELEDDQDSFGVFPIGMIEGLAAITLGRLIEFFDRLKVFRKQMQPARTPLEWNEQLWCLLEGFFDSGHFADATRPLRQLLDDWTQHIQLARMDSVFSFDVLRSSLNRYAMMAQGKVFSVASGVRFMPISAAAFQSAEVICMLGLNNQAWPRLDRKSDLDLMSRESPRAGDYSQRMEDRYLFLQCLLNAGKVFYLSYTGKSMRDNSTIPPALPVSELRELLHDGLDENEFLPLSVFRQHALQPFDKRYFTNQHSKFFSYSQNMADIASLRTAAAEQKQLAVECKTLSSTEIDIADLLAFYRNSSRFFIERVIGAKLPFEEVPEEDHEAFVLSGLESWQLRSVLLQGVMRGELDVGRVAKRQTLLPHANPGVTVAVQEQQRVEWLVKRFEGLRPQCEQSRQKIDFKLETIRIYGYLSLFESDIQVDVRPGSVRADHELGAWLTHLIACVHFSDRFGVTTTLLGYSGGIRFAHSVDAADILTRLVNIYVKSLSQPVPLFNQSAHVYVEEDCSLAEANKKWCESEHYNEYSSNLSHRILWPDYSLDAKFESVAIEVFRDLFDHREVCS